MAIPFWTNAWLYSYMPDVANNRTIYKSDGTVYLTLTGTYSPSTHARLNPSVNRRRPLPGSSTPWIPPSSYTRWAHTWDLYGLGSYRATATLNFKDAPIGVTNATLAYSTGDKFQRNTLFMGMTGNRDVSNPDLLNAERRARTKALGDLANSKAGMGENLAQVVKTADLFLDLGSDVIRAAIAIKKGNFVKAIKQLDIKDVKELIKAKKLGKIAESSADRWLQYWYGIRPLVLDTYGLYELLREQLEPALLVHGRGSGRHAFESDWVSGRVDSTSPKYHFTETGSVSARCNLTGRVNSADYLRTINRVGMLNPVGLAWDLVPFSFVVDWVYPIGDVAHGLSATAGLSFVGGHTTIQYERFLQTEIAQEDQRGASPSAIFQSFGFTRSALGTFPRPVTYYKSPFLGSSRIATVLALIAKLGPRGLN